MYFWTIETHQMQSGDWVGVVRRRPDGKTVRYMSDYHPASVFAFMECTKWIEDEKVRDFTDGTLPLTGEAG